jgi:hypothetical protein
MRRRILLALFFSVACQQQSVVAQPRSELPRVTEIEKDRVHTLLAPDAITSIDEPKFMRASEATFMDDDEPVVGVVVSGVAKAYSTWHLDHHEIVNDTIALQPLAVTW